MSTTTYAVLDDDGKTVARVRRSRGRLGEYRPAVAGPDRRRAAAWLRRRGEVGREATPAAEAAGRRSAGGRTRSGRTRCRGSRRAGSVRMTAAQPADVAVAGALLDNLARAGGRRRRHPARPRHRVPARVPGRRPPDRSVLKLLGDVLPEGVPRAGGSRSCAGSGRSRRPGRDLDVYVRGVARAGSRPGPPGETWTSSPGTSGRSGPRRTRVFGAPSARSGSPRSAPEWRAALESVIASPRPDALTAGALADQRLHRTFRKVARRAKAISPASPSEEIHDLRKACKELRYLLEMFRPLCDPATFKAVHGRLQGSAGRARRVPGRRGAGRGPAGVRRGDAASSAAPAPATLLSDG